MQGKPVTLDAVRVFLGTPQPGQLTAASLDQNLQFLRYMIDPRKAENQQLTFTISAQGNPQIRQVKLRNSVMVISPSTSRASNHVDLTQQALADFILGKGTPTKGAEPLAALDHMLDRSRLLPHGTTSGNSTPLEQ